MKKNRIMPIFFFSLTMFLISFVLGYRLMGKHIKEKDYSKLSKSEISLEDEFDLEILLEENVITPNTVIEERINHTTCSHVITKVREIEFDLVNMTKEEFKDYMESNYPNIKLVSFSSSKIVLSTTKNHLCENHYIIGEEEGYIAVFKIDEDGNRILQSIFEDSPISLLMEVDQEKIIKGIIVDSEEELTEILENFIS